MGLPVEVIQRIFSFLSPCEIVRLRQVSKQFRDITHNSSLWIERYTNSGLLLPPGPFPLQSTRYLERTLVQSDLISRTWTSQPLQVRSRTLTSWKRGTTLDLSRTTVFGRWCIFLQEGIIRCHDIDADTYHTLYDGSALPGFWFEACTGNVTYIEGHWVYLFLVDGQQHDLISLLGFRVNGDGFSKPEIIDLSPMRLQLSVAWHSTHNFHGSVPFIMAPFQTPCVVFDLRTHRLYRLLFPEVPEYLSALSPTYQPCIHVALTRTHIIAVRMYVRGGIQDTGPALVQAFAVPDSVMSCDKLEVDALCFTHEAAIQTKFSSFGLLRNSTVDPITGSVSIRLLHITTTELGARNGHKRMSCLDLTLPKPVSATDVLPISICSHTLFESRWSIERYTASDDGHARGLLFTVSEPPRESSVNGARKFTIDASGEGCIIVVSDPSPFDLPVRPNEVAFDGTRGRTHYFQCVDDVNQVVTVDLA